ncbi:MAG: serine protease [Pseudomonadota bacterium]
MRIPHDQIRSIFYFLFLSFIASPLWASDISKTIETIKPSVVGIASYEKTRVPALRFIGTGFAVGNGQTIITNAHVVKAIGAGGSNEVMGVITGKGAATDFRPATLVDTDVEHDLAQLNISGAPLPVLKIGDSGIVKEGRSLVFTGFPIGMALGFHHVTHRTMIASITPISSPALHSQKLTPNMIAQLRNSAYSVFQLDGTAYPGNSGSPLYDPETGEVFGIINKVFIKDTKENVLSNPSGITYAIPSVFIRAFLDRKK